MKIAVISDIHSNIEALEAVIKYCSEEVDAYFCLGDIVGYGASPNETIDAIRGIDLIGCIAGNHDAAVIEGDFTKFRTDHGVYAIGWTARMLTAASRDFLMKIWHARNFNLFLEYGFAAFHGGPQDNLWQYVFPQSYSGLCENAVMEKSGSVIKKVDGGQKCLSKSSPVFKKRADFSGVEAEVIFVGHSHLQFKFEIGQKIVANPGSVGQPRNGDPAAHFLIFDTITRSIDFQKIEYDIAYRPALIYFLHRGFSLEYRSFFIFSMISMLLILFMQLKCAHLAPTHFMQYLSCVILFLMLDIVSGVIISAAAGIYGPQRRGVHTKIGQNKAATGLASAAAA